MSKYEVNVSLELKFTPYPRTTDDEWNAFFDALPEYWWEPFRWYDRHLLSKGINQPSIASTGRIIELAFHRRTLTKRQIATRLLRQAEHHGVYGAVIFNKEYWTL